MQILPVVLAGLVGAVIGGVVSMQARKLRAGRTRRPVWTRGKWLDAVDAGHCGVCRTPIRPGDPIFRSRKRGRTLCVHCGRRTSPHSAPVTRASA